MLIKGARPIRERSVSSWYQQHAYTKPTLEDYTCCWRDWLTDSSTKILQGLNNFKFGDYAQGTSQCFDHFALRHGSERVLTACTGDFQYHACIGRHLGFQYINAAGDLRPDHALIMSVPFSDLGRPLPEMNDILATCTDLGVPVLLDLAYWGISRTISLDLDRWPCITQVVCSLSKSFFVLENHRVGVRFSRDYLDDGITMQNEVGMQNLCSMSLGLHFMRRFSCDWNWHTHGSRYETLCQQMKLDPTDVVIFAVSQDPKYQEFSRGRPGHYRLCLANFLSDDT